MFKELAISNQRLYHQIIDDVKNWTKIVAGNLDPSSKPANTLSNKLSLNITECLHLPS